MPDLYYGKGDPPKCYYIYLNQAEADALGVKDGQVQGTYAGKPVEFVIYKPFLTEADYDLMPKSFTGLG